MTERHLMHPMRRYRVPFLLVALLVAAVSLPLVFHGTPPGAAGGQATPTRAELVSLRVIPAAGRLATIIMDPGQCVACEPSIQSMLYTYRLHPDLFELRLTRPPTRRERRELMLRGLWHNVVIDSLSTDATVAGRPVVVYRYSDASIHPIPIEAAVALSRAIRPIADR